MIIYIDNDYKCHVNNDDGNMIEIETSFFDNKCETFIEGYRFIPLGMAWSNPNGDNIEGEMIEPWKPYEELYASQIQYETDLITQKEILQVLGVEV